MDSDGARDPVCPVCARPMPAGSTLTFMRRDNLIHVGCLAAAQRRVEESHASIRTATPEPA
jgi:hypothetical protein